MFREDSHNFASVYVKILDGFVGVFRCDKTMPTLTNFCF